MTANLSPAALEAIKRMQQSELTEGIICEKLAKFVKGDENKQTLPWLSQEEKSHYQVWKKYTGLKMKPEKAKVLKYIFLPGRLALPSL